MSSYNAGDITANLLFENFSGKILTEDSNSWIYDEVRYETYVEHGSDYIPLLTGMIIDISEDMGDDYSKWLGKEEILSIANKAIENDEVWTALENFLHEEIENTIIEIRGLPRRRRHDRGETFNSSC